MTFNDFILTTPGHIECDFLRTKSFLIVSPVRQRFTSIESTALLETGKFPVHTHTLLTQ